MIHLNDQGAWLIEQLTQLIKSEKSYEQRAVWQGLKTLVQQQQVRLNQIKSEIDGKLWNHEQW